MNLLKDLLFPLIIRDLKIVVFILIIFIVGVACSKDDETALNKKPTQEEYLEVLNQLENEQEAEYFTNMLKSAGIQFEDSSKLTLFVIPDNLYIKDVETDNEEFLENHIVKGTYRLKDFKTSTELIAINGNKIQVQKIDPDENVFRANETVSCGLKEIEINGNIIHYVYSPIFCTQTDYNNYLSKTRSLFSEFVEYSYVFDAVLTDIATAINESWTAIDNHTFNWEDEKIEKLWFDAFYLLARTSNLRDHYNDDDKSIFAENSLIQGIVASILLNYFGELPIYDDPSQMFNQTPAASSQDVMYWTIEKAYLAEQLAQNDKTEDAASSLNARIYWLQGSMQNYTEAHMKSKNIIESGNYSLSGLPGDYYNSIDSPENIFAVINPGIISTDLSNQKMVLPVFRYSETCLTFCYCANEIGMLGDANNILQTYEENKGYQVSEFLNSPNEIREKIKEYWLSEFGFEGIRFMALKAFGLTEEVLNIPEYMKVLPIPKREIENNPAMTQNPGY